MYDHSHHVFFVGCVAKGGGSLLVSDSAKLVQCDDEEGVRVHW